MSCCQGKRRAFHSNPSPETREPQRMAAPAMPQASMVFEYAGGTALTAVGAITGRRYRFNHPGAAVDVDLRDASSLAGVPHLRRRRS
jgi:hypothetical protein